MDWDARAAAFDALADTARSRRAPYDCVIPVSGGKDSHWQVVTCLARGLHPLGVSWRPPRRTEIGERNLRNLVSLGVDHIDFSIDPAVERRFTRTAFERSGSSAVPMHLALFAIPLTIAVRYGIPLVIWGEDSSIEYGGADRSDGWLDARWLQRYGVTGGTGVRDWISETLSERDLTPYAMPTDGELERAGVSAVFLGHYFQWDPLTSYAIAREHGFIADPAGPRVGVYDHTDLDDQLISIHHYMKWYKFGFTRSFDNLSLEIRNGRLTRDQAIAIIRERGDETPHADIAAFCAFTEMSEARFFEICERFRDTRIWTMRNGTWRIDAFLIPDRHWR